MNEIEKIYFHDSCVCKMECSNSDIVMVIDVCMWMQDGYIEGDEELKESTIKFSGVSEYSWKSGKKETNIDYDSIIDMSIADNHVKFIMDDFRISIVEFNYKKCSIMQ